MSKEEGNDSNPSFYVYLVGVILLGLFYGKVKPLLGSGLLFVVAVILYLLALRFTSDYIAKKWRNRKAT